MICALERDVVATDIGFASSCVVLAIEANDTVLSIALDGAEKHLELQILLLYFQLRRLKISFSHTF